MLRIDDGLTPSDLLSQIHRLWDLSAAKIVSLEESWNPANGAPVFTVAGRYTSRGWTDWTEGFQYGSALLQYEATGERRFLELGRSRIMKRMPQHLTHFGVHDHGFHIISTYGNLRRLILAGAASDGDLDVCETALRVSGAVQAHRWTPIVPHDDLPVQCGYIHSFNGPHSLFVDTIRSLRSLAVAHVLGQTLKREQDEHISLMDRLCAHAAATARYSVYYGEGRDIYDVRGRTAHECLFNPTNGTYRCPSTQQGYSPFSTWTRGLAWAMCGFAEQLDFFERAQQRTPAMDAVEPLILKAARATCDYYTDIAAADGVPYWDTGAPGLTRMPDWPHRPAEPCNLWEPVDSSAAAIAAQALIRFGLYEQRHGKQAAGRRYLQAGLTTARTLFSPPYLSEDPAHQGLILHSVYHRPNGWDYVPANCNVPCGESSMWGDYHARELALIVQRLAEGEPLPTFFGSISGTAWNSE